MPPGSVEARVAVLTEALQRIDRELERGRTRMHTLESDRATLGIVTAQMHDLSEQMPTLARRAAREAVDEYLRRQHANMLGTWRTYAALLSAGAAVGAIIVTLVTR